MSENSVLANNSSYKEILLRTLIVCINVNDVDYYVRGILDTGSQKSYVSKFIVEPLKLKCLGEESVNHGLFGGIVKQETHKRYCIELSNIDKSFSLNVNVMDQEKICIPLPKLNDANSVRELKNFGIYISDIFINDNVCLCEKDPKELHFLLGADVASKIFTGDIKHLGKGLLAVKTKLGWTIMGKIDNNDSKMENSLSSLSLSLHVSDSKLTDLWRLDTLGISAREENQTKNLLEEETKKHFANTIRKDKTGRYEVSLPWVVDSSISHNNRFIAEKCLVKTENKLSTNHRDEYQKMFEFWESENIIEVVNDNKISGTHYLPHRPVFKENSETKKIRPVFNASAHTSNKPSLNDCLTKGPNLIEIIPSIVNRFRKYRIGISSDIEKAFLQINVRENDRDFLRFFVL
nr:uncharacterized protein LOC107454528 [Parasteatoda tepidariorum]